MARKFSYPEVAALLVAGSCFVRAPASEVKRKVALYGRRHRKAFVVIRSYMDLNFDGSPIALVTRLPDPEPEVA